MEILNKYYVYRYIHNDEIIYIGKTNDLNRRDKEHKSDKWYHDKLKYEYIQVDNEFITQLYEVYLINRDNPKENIASKNNYDVSDIKFNIEETWKPVIIKERSNKAKIKKCNEKNAKKSNKALVMERQMQEIDDKFMELISKHKKEIIKVYYDEYEFLTVILKCSQFKELLGSKYMPSCVIGITFNQNSNIVVIQFNKDENLQEKYKEKYNEIYELLDVNKLNLDMDYGKKLLSIEMNNIEKKYMSYIDNKYQITLVRIKDNFEIGIPINTLLELFGGLVFVYRFPFALGLKYKCNRNILLIHYEPIKYDEILNNELKEEFKYQYYFKNDKAMELFEYLLYEKQMPNRISSGCTEYDESVGVYYLPRESVLKVDIAKSIICNEQPKHLEKCKELNNGIYELYGFNDKDD